MLGGNAGTQSGVACTQGLDCSTDSGLKDGRARREPAYQQAPKAGLFKVPDEVLFVLAADYLELGDLLRLVHASKWLLTLQRSGPEWERLVHKRRAERTLVLDGPGGPRQRNHTQWARADDPACHDSVWRAHQESRERAGDDDVRFDIDSDEPDPGSPWRLLRLAEGPLALDIGTDGRCANSGDYTNHATCECVPQSHYRCTPCDGAPEFSGSCGCRVILVGRGDIVRSVQHCAFGCPWATPSTHEELEIDTQGNWY
jgi:hypothetical protein